VPVPIRRRFKAFSGLAILTLWADVCLAEHAPTDGITCFCLLHEASEQVLHGCKGTLLPNATSVTAICTGEGPEPRLSRLNVAPPWSVIPDGAEYCNPCKLGPAAGSRPPRGDGSP
jgi:hypothetical protein